MQMQRIAAPTYILLAFAAALPACDAPDDGDGTEFREYPFAGDNDVAVHVGSGTTNPDCLAWELADTYYYTGPITLGNLQWSVTGLGDEIFDASGQLVCTMHTVGPDYVELREGTSGPVVASQWHNHAFYGDVSSIPESTRWQFADYTYNGPHLAEGPWYGEVVVTATEYVEWAQTKRKLGIAALVMGVCGSPGLPDNAWPEG